MEDRLANMIASGFAVCETRGFWVHQKNKCLILRHAEMSTKRQVDVIGCNCGHHFVATFETTRSLMDGRSGAPSQHGIDVQVPNATLRLANQL